MTTATQTAEPTRTTLDIEPPREPAPLATFDLNAEPARRPQVLAAEPAPAADQRAIPITIFASSQEIGELIAALALAQAEFGEIERSMTAHVKSKSTGVAYDYQYAPLDNVLQAVRPFLAKNGIAIMQFPFTRSHSLTVRTLIAHKSGQWIYNELAAALIGADPQSIGSAITYLRRYGAQSLLGVAPGVDDDGQQAGMVGGADVVDTPKPSPRKSQGNGHAAASPVLPASVGRIVDVAEQGGAALLKLDTGFQCATRDVELIAGAKRLHKSNATVECSTRPSSDPDRFAPVLTELSLQVGR
jgi:hypothetical protein